MSPKRHVKINRTRHTDGPQTHEKMLNIAKRQGNTIKTTMRSHYARMSIMRKTTKNKCWRGLQTGPATMENGMENPQKIKRKTTV